MEDNNFNFNNMNQNNMNQPGGNPKKPKKKMSFKMKLLISCCGALVIGVVGGVALQFTGMASEMLKTGNSALESQLEKDTYVNEDPLEETAVLSDVSLDNSVTSVVEDTLDSVVSITSTIESVTSFFGQEYSSESEGAGSGFIIEEDDTYYYIATNNHVVEGASKITVTFADNEDVEGTVKGTDTTGDLAVVTVKKKSVKDSTKKAIKVATLGDSSDCKVGDTVVAIGNALAQGQSVTVGCVSAVDREVDVENVGMKLIQTDAAINAGNSGGPLINMSGEVIGINSSKLVDTSVEGMCFAIPISNATTILNELMNADSVKDGEEGYIGIAGTAISSDDSETYSMPVGVYVSEIPTDSAAEDAGVQVGDIITKLNGVGVSTVDALVERANAYKAGTEVTLTIERYNNGTYEEKELTLKLMTKKKFESLEYSSKVSSGSDSSSDSSDSGSSDSGSSDSDGSSGYSDDELQEFYDYFSQYFGNSN